MNPTIFRQTHYLKAAQSKGDYPEDQGTEIIFLGRSNVGKSSAINALTEQKKLAKTSKTPGRTQLIHFFTVSESLRLVDVPGYGFTKIHASIAKQWHHMLQEYFDSRHCLKLAILFIDIRHDPLAKDIEMLQWLGSYCPAYIVFTKVDKLSRNSAFQHQKKYLKKLREYTIATPDSQLFSATKKQGIHELQCSILNKIITEPKDASTL